MTHKKKKNNKAALFFVLLVLVGYVFVKFGQGVSTKSEAKASYEEEVASKPEECVNCDDSIIIEEEIVHENSEPSVIMVDDKYTVDITESVEGARTSLFGCDHLSPVNTLDSATKLCPKSSVDWDVVSASSSTGIARWLGTLLSTIIRRGGQDVKIDSETEIELVTVTYPLAFFLGQHTMQDSNREANIESPNYSSSGQMIDENYTLKTQSPHLVEELREELKDTVRQHYTVWTDADVEGGGHSSEYDENTEYEYEVIVTNADHDPKSLCPEEVTTSDYNPGSPNRQGSRGGGFFRTQIPGGDPVVEKNSDMCLEVDQDYKMITSGLHVACIDLVNLVKGRIASIFSIRKWESCKEPQVECTVDEEGEEVCVTIPLEDCLNTRNIGIKMSPIYGAVDECTDELCANAYLTNSYKAGLSPLQVDEKREISSNYEESLMFFLGTKCLANIKIGGIIKQIPVTCLWDASPLLLDYKIQAQYKYPGQEGFPQSFDYYWYLVEQAIEESAIRYGLEPPEEERDDLDTASL